MMRKKNGLAEQEKATAVGKAIGLFRLILADGGQRPAIAIARQAGLPQATAYRLLKLLCDEGLITPLAPGYYGAGGALVALIDPAPGAPAWHLARQYSRQLARMTGLTVHIGVLAGDMVTYVLKESAAGIQLFTREGMQLEAYCSGVGKVLLASLDEAAQQAYLAGGPFVALTARTLIDPLAMRAHWRVIRRVGYAVDDEEVSPGLYCVAVPLHAPSGETVAAISVSGPLTAGQRLPGGRPHPALLGRLKRCARAIEHALPVDAAQIWRAAAHSADAA